MHQEKRRQKNYIQKLVDKNMGLKVYDEFQAPVVCLI